MVEVQGSETKVVTADELNVETLRIKYERLLDRPEVFPSEANWDFLIQNKVFKGVAKKLYHKYLVASLVPEEQSTGWYKIALRKFPEYLCAIPRNVALDTVYSYINSKPEFTSRLINECQLFDAQRLAVTLQQGFRGFTVDCLTSYQPEYTLEDYRDMKMLDNMLSELVPLGTVEEKSGFFRRDNQYVCPSGHRNPSTEQYCATAGCGIDIYGFTKPQRQNIEIFRSRLQALANLLEKRS